MIILTHIAIFILSGVVIWFFAGLLLEAVDSVARKLNQSGFSLAFLVLGLLTSISEISVAVNSLWYDRPEVSAGNLVGATGVLLLFVIPFLAVLGKGVDLRRSIKQRHLFYALGTALLPALFLVDGRVSRGEGVLCLMIYITLLYIIRQRPSVSKAVGLVENRLVGGFRSVWLDGLKILVGGVFIFGSGHFLVQEILYFSELLKAPPSLMGMLILSLSTNVPEITIAVRAVYKKHKNIAFGDYLGSATANALIFGLLVVIGGGFNIARWEFAQAFVVLVVGAFLLFIFARSKSRLSRGEGLVLLVFYGLFIGLQLINLYQLSIKQ